MNNLETKQYNFSYCYIGFVRKRSIHIHLFESEYKYKYYDKYTEK
jgi:hypothetical protein